MRGIPSEKERKYRPPRKANTAFGRDPKEKDVFKKEKEGCSYLSSLGIFGCDFMMGGQAWMVCVSKETALQEYIVGITTLLHSREEDTNSGDRGWDVT